MINRVAVNTALAKAIAYKQCGQDYAAEQWAREVVRLLECSEILTPQRAEEFELMPTD